MKKDMPLEGLRWSRDSGSALCVTPQTAVLGRAGGGIFVFPKLSLLNKPRIDNIIFLFCRLCVKAELNMSNKINLYNIWQKNF